MGPSAWWPFAFVDGQKLLLKIGADGLAERLEPVGWDVPFGAPTTEIGVVEALPARAMRLAQVPDGWAAVPLRQALALLPGPLASKAGRAWQLLEWARTHAFCGACATPTIESTDEPVRRCPACGLAAYPRISPAMMALVWRPGEVLLARSPHFAPGMYSALAGFVEPGESIEECLHREVAEEVGVEVEAPRYVGSQSWPFPGSLMIAFTARWRSGEIVAQAGEIEDARWFPIDALPQVPASVSISASLIRSTVEAMRRTGRPG